MTDDGAIVNSSRATLPLCAGSAVELYMDQTGVFGDDLLATDGEGSGDGSMVVVPNDASTYGPLAGKFIIVSDGAPATAIDTQGNATDVDSLLADSNSSGTIAASLSGSITTVDPNTQQISITLSGTLSGGLNGTLSFTGQDNYNGGSGSLLGSGSGDVNAVGYNTSGPILYTVSGNTNDANGVSGFEQTLDRVTVYAQTFGNSSL